MSNSHIHEVGNICESAGILTTSHFFEKCKTILKQRKRKIEQQAERGRVLATEDEYSKELFKLAEQDGPRSCSGKFIIFVRAAVADTLWASIRAKLSDSALKCDTVGKSSSNTNDSRITIRIANWMRHTETELTLLTLNRLCRVHNTRIHCFKPEFLTELGVYRGDMDGAKFSYKELGWKYTPAPPSVTAAMRAYMARGKRGRRKNRKVTQKQRTTICKAYVNKYRHRRRSNPSCPNGTWTESEKKNGYIMHAGPTEIQGRVADDVDCVRNAILKHLEENKQRLIAKRLSPQERQAVVAQMYEIADEFNMVEGKWKIFADAKVADEIWLDLIRANSKGLLGGTIKCLKFNKRTGKFLICCYVDDFTNVDGCRKVLLEAQKITQVYGVSITANFKADFLTACGIYCSHKDNRKITLNTLGLAKYWHNAALKAVLGDVKLLFNKEKK